ncbi:MAG: DUF4834 family protein [Bacteroidaceae bacterium]|nr:DUF4834 family protein [Bacteroidaceae bacterium]
MLKFLGCLGALLFGLIFLALALLQNFWQFVRTLLGLHNPTSSAQGPQTGGARQSAHQSNQSGRTASTGQPSEKIFERDDSEYVDFEEIK